jgi:hypothetical protein
MSSSSLSSPVSVRLDSLSSGHFSPAFGDFNYLKFVSTLQLGSSPPEVALKRQALSHLSDMLRRPTNVSSLFEYSLVPELLIALQSGDPIIRRLTSDILHQFTRSHQGRQFLLDDLVAHSPSDLSSSALAQICRLVFDPSVFVRLSSLTLLNSMTQHRRGAHAALEELKLPLPSSVAAPVDGSLLSLLVHRLSVEPSIAAKAAIATVLSQCLQWHSDPLRPPPESELLIYRYPALLPALAEAIHKTIEIDEKTRKQENKTNKEESKGSDECADESCSASDCSACLTYLCQAAFHCSTSSLGKRLTVLSEGLVSDLTQLIAHPEGAVRQWSAATLTNATNSLPGKVSFIHHGGLGSLLRQLPAESSDAALAAMLELMVNALEHPLSREGSNAAARSSETLALLNSMVSTKTSKIVQMALQAAIEKIQWKP